MAERDSGILESFHASPFTRLTVLHVTSPLVLVNFSFSSLAVLVTQFVAPVVSSHRDNLGSGAIRQLGVTLWAWGGKFSMISTVDMVSPFSVCRDGVYYYFLLGC